MQLVGATDDLRERRRARGNIGVYKDREELSLRGQFRRLRVWRTSVYGFSSAGSGVVGECSTSLHAAVTGTNTSTSTSGYGGYFTANASSGTRPSTGMHHRHERHQLRSRRLRGRRQRHRVSGIADSATGSTTGVSALASSPDGTALFAWNTATTGVTYGVMGVASSTSGYAGYFEGRGYFQDRVGIGLQQPAASLHVVGGGDLTLSGGGALILGQVASANLVMDPDEIQARNNGAAPASLYINANGGNVGINTNNAMGFSACGQWAGGEAGRGIVVDAVRRSAQEKREAADGLAGQGCRSNCGV